MKPVTKIAVGHVYNVLHSYYVLCKQYSKCNYSNLSFIKGVREHYLKAWQKYRLNVYQ